MNETLIDALSGIADAIRAKGISGTMNAWQMPTKIEEIQTEKYGIPVDGFVGDVDENGNLMRATVGGDTFSFRSSDIVSIPSGYFQSSFRGRNVLDISLPNLTTIGTYTFEWMAALSPTLSSVSMPELSAIPNFGLQYAFRGCSALESVDLDSVQTVGESGLQGCCYNDPALVRFNAPSISSVGQGGMYRCLSGCTSLEEVCLSSLTSAGNQGLDECFMGCTSLKKVQMPLSYAGTNALRNTFNGCSALEEVDFRGATSVPNLSNVNCFENTNEDFVIYVPENLSAEWVASVNWSSQDVVKHIYGYNPSSGGHGLIFTAEEANSTVDMSAVGSAPSVSLEYTTDNGTTWNDFIVGTTTVTLANVGDQMAVRAKTTNSGFSTATTAYNKFVMTGKIAASGSVMYLLKNDGDLDTIPTNYCFNSLLRECVSLTTAPEFPATTLTTQCYRNMFNGCTSLTTPPETLPATTLTERCYTNMFYGCTALTTSPEISATTLATYCFTTMFSGCSSLSSIKLAYTGNFSGTGVPTNAFSNWVSNIASTGTFYYNGSDTTRGTSAIPNNWTVQSF